MMAFDGEITCPGVFEFFPAFEIRIERANKSEKCYKWLFMTDHFLDVWSDSVSSHFVPFWRNLYIFDNQTVNLYILVTVWQLLVTSFWWHRLSDSHFDTFFDVSQMKNKRNALQKFIDLK